MIGGQVMDLESEHKAVNLEQLQEIHRKKTAALITASVEFGAIIADAQALGGEGAGLLLLYAAIIVGLGPYSSRLALDPDRWIMSYPCAARARTVTNQCR